MSEKNEGNTVKKIRSTEQILVLTILLFTYFLETFQVAYAQKAEDLPQIVSWQDGKGYQSDGTFIADGWGYDTVNPAGKYVLFDENGMVQLRTETMDPVNAVFFEWNLSVNSGNYRLKSVEATQNDQKYVAEFDNNYKNLPEQGLIIMKIKVKNELVEAVQTEKKQNKTDQQNNIQNPEKSDSGIKNTEVVTTVKKTGQKTGIIIGGLSFLGAAMWLLYRKFHRKK